VGTEGGDAAVSFASPSGTWLQEAGIDEADLLKSDGTHLYTLRRKLMFAENGLRLSNVYREGYRLELAPAAAGASGD
jgi:uncharacterized secreted protein with C-terminal beta-propeller domain